MDIGTALAISGIIVAIAIGTWQIVLAQKQMNAMPKIELTVDPKLATDSPILIGGVRWLNSGNLFWLAHDLMLTIYEARRNADRDHVVFGLRQSLHNLRCLGLAGTEVEKMLAQLKYDVGSRDNANLSPQEQERVSEECASYIKYIGTLSEIHQPDFVARPDSL